VVEVRQADLLDADSATNAFTVTADDIVGTALLPPHRLGRSVPWAIYGVPRTRPAGRFSDRANT